ncbi:MAG TPA: hypothetical protein VMR28_01635 [Candidatus Saccharimonadales bacterium]|nr:hypothetical protein [Candidatus Saccharimonadales bacterium]
MRTIQQLHILKRFRLLSVVSAVFCLSFAGLDNALVNASNISFQTARDCNSNAIISCGSLTTGQLISAYNSNSYAQKVYGSLGINSNDIKNLAPTATAGYVDKNGNVYLNGRPSPVATNAMTAGRQDTVGSKALSSGGVNFYMSPLSLALTTNSVDAFVVMRGGGFDYAIIAGCDNPVITTTTKVATSKKPSTTSPVLSRIPRLRAAPLPWL